MAYDMGLAGLETPMAPLALGSASTPASTRARSPAPTRPLPAMPGYQADDTHVPDKTRAMLRPLFNTVTHWSGGDSVVDKMLLNMLSSLPPEGREAAVVVKGDAGHSLLQTACQAHATPVVEILLRWGAVPAEVDEWGASALHLAAATAHVENRNIFQMLLDAAAASEYPLDPNIPDLRGSTPLHYAAGAGDPEACSWLMNNGADPSAADQDGFTASGYASQAGSVDALRAIENKIQEIAAAKLEAEAKETLDAAHDHIERIVDEDSGYAYYLNMRTGESRWETEEEAIEYQTVQQHKELMARQKRLAFRKQAADRKAEIETEKTRRKEQEKEDALDYFADIVKHHMKPEEKKVLDAEIRKMSAKRVQSLARQREHSFRVKQKKTEEEKADVARAIAEEKAKQEEREEAIRQSHDETWWREEKKRILEERKQARLAAELQRNKQEAQKQYADDEALLSRLIAAADAAEESGQDDLHEGGYEESGPGSPSRLPPLDDKARKEIEDLWGKPENPDGAAQRTEDQEKKTSEGGQDVPISRWEAKQQEKAIREVPMTIEEAREIRQRELWERSKQEAAAALQAAREEAGMVPVRGPPTAAAASPTPGFHGALSAQGGDSLSPSGSVRSAAPGSRPAPTHSPVFSPTRQHTVEAALAAHQALQVSHPTSLSLGFPPKSPVVASGHAGRESSPTGSAASDSNTAPPRRTSMGMLDLSSPLAGTMLQRDTTSIDPPSALNVGHPFSPSGSASPASRSAAAHVAGAVAGNSPTPSTLASPTAVAPQAGAALGNSPVSPSGSAASGQEPSTANGSGQGRDTDTLFSPPHALVRRKAIRATFESPTLPSPGGGDHPDAAALPSPSGSAASKGNLLPQNNVHVHTVFSPAHADDPHGSLWHQKQHQHHQQQQQQQPRELQPPSVSSPSGSAASNSPSGRPLARTPAQATLFSPPARQSAGHPVPLHERRASPSRLSLPGETRKADGETGSGRDQQGDVDDDGDDYGYGDDAFEEESASGIRSPLNHPTEAAATSDNSDDDSRPVPRRRPASAAPTSLAGKPRSPGRPPQHPDSPSSSTRSPARQRSRSHAGTRSSGLLRVWRQAAWRVGADRLQRRRLSEMQRAVAKQSKRQASPTSSGSPSSAGGIALSPTSRRASTTRLGGPSHPTSSTDDAYSRRAAFLDNEALTRTLAAKLADANVDKASAELRARQEVRAEVDRLVMHAQESNYRLWASLTREQAMRREEHEKLESMKGPVRIHCRIRPLTSVEESRGYHSVLVSLPSGVVELKPSKTLDSLQRGRRGSRASLPSQKAMQPRYFQYDAVYNAGCPQYFVFQDVRPLIQSAIDGHSVCIAAFGPPRSGKTYTMFGPEGNAIAGELSESTMGIAQRCGQEIFRLLALEGGDVRAQDPEFIPYGVPIPSEPDKPMRLRPQTAPPSPAKRSSASDRSHRVSAGMVDSGEHLPRSTAAASGTAWGEDRAPHHSSGRDMRGRTPQTDSAAAAPVSSRHSRRATLDFTPVRSRGNSRRRRSRSRSVSRRRKPGSAKPSARPSTAGPRYSSPSKPIFVGSGTLLPAEGRGGGGSSGAPFATPSRPRKSSFLGSATGRSSGGGIGPAVATPPSSSSLAAPVGLGDLVPDDRPPAAPITPLGLSLGDWVTGSGARVIASTPQTSGRPATASSRPTKTSGPAPSSKQGWVRWGTLGVEAKVRLNVLEVRNNMVYDMLRKARTPPVPLKLRVGPDGTSAVQDAVGVLVSSPDQFAEVIRSGMRRCHPRPSSAHLVVRVVIHVRRELDGMERRGKVYLVDMASPVRIVPDGMSEEGVEELRDVAVSLYRFGEVLTSVARQEDAPPYAMHTLTQLVYEGIASGKSLLLTHANPTGVEQTETERALRFAARIKRAKHDVGVGVLSHADPAFMDEFAPRRS